MWFDLLGRHHTEDIGEDCPRTSSDEFWTIVNNTDTHLRDLWVSVVEAADKASNALVTYSSGTPQVTEDDSTQSSFGPIQTNKVSHTVRNTIFLLLFIFAVVVVGFILLMVALVATNQ